MWACHFRGHAEMYALFQSCSNGWLATQAAEKQWDGMTLSVARIPSASTHIHAGEGDTIASAVKASRATPTSSMGVKISTSVQTHITRGPRKAFASIQKAHKCPEATDYIRCLRRCRCANLSRCWFLDLEEDQRD